MLSSRFVWIWTLVTALLLTACGGGDRATRGGADASAVARAPEPVAALPAVPASNEPLAIDLAYPRPGAQRPAADSTFLFGTVGTGQADLRINGMRIPLAANGSFLAYLPVADVYRVTATSGGRTDTATFRYGQRLTPADARRLDVPRTATVISGRDTLDAGSQIVAGRTTPGGDRQFFFPRGARLTVDATLPGHVRVRLTDSTTAWVDEAAVQTGEAVDTARAAEAAPGIGPVRAVSAPEYFDVRLPVDFAPFDITAEAEAVGVTVYGRTATEARVDLGGDGFVQVARWTQATPDRSRLFLPLNAPVWGYKAFYTSDGTLVLRLRRPPRATRSSDTSGTLGGLRILVDAGHPPGGALGPSGLTEAEANLDIAQRVATRLRERGASVGMTRTGAAPLENASWAPDELWARVDLAVRSNAHLLVSIHNNAFPDGTNPFENVGSEAYYFHPFARNLAEAMAGEIAGVTGLPNKGARRRSLALVRPTWMPAVLTESLYMMFPQQEAALRNPAFLDRLAEAHVRAIEQFVRARTSRSPDF